MEERLRTLCFLSLEKRRQRGDFIALCSSCWEVEGSASLFSLVADHVRYETDTKLEKKHHFTMKNRLPGVVVDAPCGSVFKRYLGNALVNTL